MGHWSEPHNHYSNEVWVEDGRNDDPICPWCGNSDVAKMAQRYGNESLTRTYCKECGGSFDAVLRKCPKCGVPTLTESIHRGLYYCVTCGVLMDPVHGAELRPSTGKPDGTKCPNCGSSNTTDAAFGKGWLFCNSCMYWFDPKTGRHTLHGIWIEAHFNEKWEDMYDFAQASTMKGDEEAEPEEAEATDWREVWSQAWK